MRRRTAFWAAWAERNERLHSIWIFSLSLILVCGFVFPPAGIRAGEQAPDNYQYYRIIFNSPSDLSMLEDAGIEPLVSGEWGAYMRLEPDRAAQIPGLEEIPSRTIIHMEEQGLDVDTSEGFSLTPDWSNPGSELKLVQFVCPCPGKWVESVERISCPILRSIGDNTIVVRATPGQEKRIGSLDYVEWTGPYEPRYKVFENLIRMTGNMRITVTACPDIQTGRLMTELADLGATDIEDTHFGAATCSLDAWLLPAVARLDSVLLIEHLPEMKTLCSASGRVVQAHDLWVNTVSNLPLNITGQGQIVHVQDTGLDASYRDFTSGPLGNRIGYTEVTTDSQYHGTFMTGIIAGNGYNMEVYLGQPTTDRIYNSLAASNPAGMPDRMGFAGRAPEATIYSRAGLSSAEWAAGYTYGARIFSNSWGPATISNSYDGTADTFMNSNSGALVLFACGSDGPAANTVSGYGNGKLVLSVSGFENVRPVQGEGSDDPDQMRQMDSRGPVADGRVKPDIVEIGGNVYGPKSDDATEATIAGLYDTLNLINTDGDAIGDYIMLSGTSVAVAAASGDAALVRDYLVDVRGIPAPHANLIKTLLIHGAEDMGYGYPSFDQGWGRVNVRNSICPAFPNVLQWYHNNAGIGSGSWSARTDGGLQTWVADDTVPLKVTMAHWDAVGSGTLTYDLDLVVTSPSGARYEGNAFKEAWSIPVYTPANWSDAHFPSWMGNASYDWDTADDGGDDINNVELFRIQNPEKGQWNVQVVWKSSTARAFTLAMTGGFNASADINAASNLYKVSMQLDRPRVVPERDDFGEAIFTAAPSGSIIVPYWINNGGTTNDTYALTAPILASGFTVAYTPTSPMTINAGKRAHGFATVSVSGAVAAGTYTIALKALSGGDSTAPVAQSTIKFQVDVQTVETAPLMKIADAPVHEDSPSLVSWNSNGTDYVACAYRQEGRYGSRVYFKLSSDGGRTWGAPVPVSSPSWSPTWVTITRATSGTYAGRLAIAWDGWTVYAGTTIDTHCAYVKVAYADAPYTSWTEVNAYSQGEGRSVGNTYRALNLVWHAPTNAFMIIVETFGYTDQYMSTRDDISVGYKTSINGGATWSAMGWVDPNVVMCYYYFPHAVVDILGNIGVWLYVPDPDYPQERTLAFRYYNGAWGTFKYAWDTLDNLMNPQGVAAPQGANGNRNYCAVRKGANTDGNMDLKVIWTDDGGNTFNTNSGAGYTTGGPYVSRNDYGSRFLMDGDYTNDGYIWWTYQRLLNYDPYVQPNIVTVRDTIYGTSPDPLVNYLTCDSYSKGKQRTANLTESPGKVLVAWNQMTKQADTDVYGALIYNGFDTAPDTIGPVVGDVTTDKVFCNAGDDIIVAANLNDWSTGGSNILVGEFSTNHVVWAAMGCADGGYDSPAEAVISNMGTIHTAGWAEGWYTVWVKGIDSLGNYGGEATTRIYVSGQNATQPTPYAIDLTGMNPGSWAFISFPTDGGGDLRLLLNDSVYGDGMTSWDVAKWFNVQTPMDPWKTHRKGSTVNDFINGDSRMGIWLHLTVNGGDQKLSLGIEGSWVESIPINLYAGWNMVGYPCATPQLASDTLPVEADRISVYNNITPFIQDYADLTLVTMTHGHGYWVHVTSNCVWTVTNSTTQPTMDFTKTGPAMASPGETITYTLTYQNIGTDWATNVIITDIYPADTFFVSASPPPTVMDNMWFIGDVAPGASGSIMITVMIDPGASGSITNVAYLDYDYGRIWSNWTTILSPIIMQFSKSAPATAQPGDVINYTLTYMNLGVAWAYNVTITETYPQEVDFILSIPAPSIGDNIWIIPAVGPGGSGSINVTVGILAGTMEGTQVNNSACLEYENGAGFPFPEIWATATTLIIIDTGPVRNLNTGEYFDTIQAGIDDSNTLDGHTIAVDPGTFTENVLVDKSIVLAGAGSNLTVIDGMGLGNGITITADGTTVTGFNVTNCSSESGQTGILVCANDANIYDNSVVGNSRGIVVGGLPSNTTAVIDTTADFEAGIKSSSSENYEAETRSDNLAVQNGTLTLGNRFGDSFTFPSSDALTWKWNGLNPDGMILATVRDEEIASSALHLYAMNTGIRGGTERNLNSQLAGNFDVRVHAWGISAAEVDQNEYIAIKMWQSSANLAQITFGYDTSNYIQAQTIINGVSTPWAQYTTDVNMFFRIVRSASYLSIYYKADATTDITLDTGWSLAIQSAVGTATGPMWGLLEVLTSQYSNSQIHGYFDDFYIKQGTMSNGFRTGGTWTSALQPLAYPEALNSTTIYYNNAGSQNYIDRIEWLVNSTVLASYETNVESGSSLTIHESDLTAGSYSGINGAYQIKLYLAGNGNGSVIIDRIEMKAQSASPFYDNSIYHNSIVANNIQACDFSGMNFWDDGYPSGGNYWSDYTGTDIYSGPGQDIPGSDGIGDNPYYFTGSQDNYPLFTGNATPGPVHNLNTDEYFDTIQAAIDDSDTQNGHTIAVAAGTYDENVIVDKQLTVQGAGSAFTIINNGVEILSDYVSLSGFTVHSGGNGIVLDSVSNCSIEFNSISDCNNGIYLYFSTGNFIANNNVIGNVFGISLYYSDGNTMAGNAVSSNSDNGFHIRYSDNNILFNNSASYNYGGIYLDVSCNNNLTGNNAYSNSYDGIYAHTSSHYNIILRNTVTSNGRGGITLYLSSYCTISDNTATNNQYGFTLSTTCNYNLIENNTVSLNSVYGIYLYASHNNTIINNTVSNNLEYGFFLTATCNGNAIYHNRILNNANQASDDGSNRWDDGYPSGGNYWSDYNGTDIYSGPGQNEPGSDGIGDTPYVFEGGQDDYPLMTPNGSVYDPYPIYGYVRDYLGNAMADVNVTVTDSDTGESLMTVTNILGQYSVDLSSLPSGYSDGDFIELTTSNPSGGYNSTYVDIGLGGEQVDIIFNASDTTAPAHANESPPNNGTSGNSTPVISVDVTDLQSGVNASTIRLYIQGFSVMYDLQAIGGGYRVSYWHEAGFTSGTVVSCRIVARDYAGNLLDWTWSFTVP